MQKINFSLKRVKHEALHRRIKTNFSQQSLIYYISLNYSECSVVTYKANEKLYTAFMLQKLFAKAHKK